MLAALNNVEQMLFARREITKFPANVPLDTQEMLGLHVIQVSLLNINLSPHSHYGRFGGKLSQNLMNSHMIQSHFLTFTKPQNAYKSMC